MEILFLSLEFSLSLSPSLFPYFQLNPITLTHTQHLPFSFNLLHTHWFPSDHLHIFNPNSLYKSDNQKPYTTIQQEQSWGDRGKNKKATGDHGTTAISVHLFLSYHPLSTNPLPSSTQLPLTTTPSPTEIPQRSTSHNKKLNRKGMKTEKKKTH